ncbi:zinc uptake protein ZrgA [Yoonia sediminilitoris]|uniref:Uncharacterized protein DUF2796 n=1 Tax=Yoonia sediminilitoris TaxID=1286148 RepID=A0A2T6K9A2_9RHOB|nr:DUF2796 domain-containing protein [Yoonia sediminilitoris]PUB11352.1 uncharacterized protein DUF2796 [Yoonia sediminilitoris]RCW91169.1 uncharacterized protein DUF2796 [Yoonia sediminilitoris]
MKQTLSLIAFVAAIPAFAQETRQLDAHEHGVGMLDIAIEGTTVAMEFHAPGADIVGFEFKAESDADLAALDAAIATLRSPLDLFVVPGAADCTVTEAQAELESDEENEDHGGEHKDDHAEDDHDDHGHEDHAEEAGHTEFHAEYRLTCDNPDALSKITFAYFETFPNAQEVQVQLITSAGARAFEVERDTPILDLER